MNVLLVEDDQRMARALSATLERYGHRVLHAASCRAAREATGYDLILLDLNLPDEDGMSLCRSIREYSDVPIIILSARGGERDRILGLRHGADDYMVKPFSMGELEARIQAVMRRPRPSMNTVLKVEDLTLDLAMRRVQRAGRLISLTPKEFTLLARLASSPGKVITREQLLLDIWHDTSKSTARTLDVHITNLRAKLGKPNILETLRGVGYRIGTPTETV